MTKCKKLAKARASLSQKVRDWLARRGSETNLKSKSGLARAQKQVGFTS